MEDKADQKMNVGNETKLLMMSAYQSTKMYGYTDIYVETSKNISIYMVNCILRHLLVLPLLLPNGESHLDLQDFKRMQSSTIFLR